VTLAREPGEAEHRVVLPIAKSSIDGQWHPQIEIGLIELKVAGQRTDDRSRTRVDANLPAHDGRIGGKATVHKLFDRTTT